MEDFGDFGEGLMTDAAGPLIGGGLAQLGILGTKILMPAYSKYAGLIGAVLGGAVSAFLMTKPQHAMKGNAGLATALLIGIPRAIEDMMLPTKLGAITWNGFGAAPGGIEILNGGGGSTGMLGAITTDGYGDDAAAAAPISIQGGSFGATGF